VRKVISTALMPPAFSALVMGTASSTLSITITGITPMGTKNSLVIATNKPSID
jgi:hypothetical protein